MGRVGLWLYTGKYDGTSHFVIINSRLEGAQF